MSGAQLKYVRTAVGFLVFPCLAATHKQAAGAASGAALPIVSAGFVDWDADGRPLCMGQSDTLGIASREDDTEALRAEWGMEAPASGTEPVRERAVHICSHKDVACAEVFDKCLACPERRAAPLPPSLQAEAQAVGAGGDAESLEAGDPA